MNIICISGKARSGKDTVARLIKSRLEFEGHKTLIIHYADYLKFICKAYFDWNGEKDVEGRTLLQYVGTDVIRANNENFWVDNVINILKLFADEWEYVLIPDCRFPNEIERIKETFYNVKTVRINRPEATLDLLTDTQKQHISETALDDYKFDYVIDNNETKEALVNKIDIVIKKVGDANDK